MIYRVSSGKKQLTLFSSAFLNLAVGSSTLPNEATQRLKLPTVPVK